MLENLKRDEPFLKNSGTDLVEIGDDELLDPEEMLDSETSLGGLDGLDDYLGDEEGEEDDDDGLGYIGLGARLRRGRRRRRRGGRRLRRARAARPRRRRRRRRARVVTVTRPRRRRRRRRRARVRAAAAPRPRRRRRRGRRRATVRTIVKTVKVPGPVRRVVRRVRVGRRGRRRGRRMAGVGFGGVLSKLADTVALQSISSLGEGRRRRRRRRRGGRRLRRATVATRRRRRRRGSRRLRAGRRGRARRRRGRRRRGRRMSSLGGFSSLSSLSRMGAGLADAEVAASWPIVGPIQYLFSIPGLEALGGVTLGSFLHGVVQEGLMGMLIAKGKQMETLPQIGTGLISAIVMWELGRLVGSGNLAKFGAYYAIGKTIDGLVMKPYVVNKIFGLAGGYGLGQARVSEETELRGLSALSQARVSEEQELREVGQRIVTEEELLGDVGEEGEEESSIF